MPQKTILTFLTLLPGAAVVMLLTAALLAQNDWKTYGNDAGHARGHLTP
jgi:hypothetical protein